MNDSSQPLWRLTRPLLALAAGLLSGCGPDQGPSDAPTRLFYDAPVGFVATEDVPFPPPEPWERELDRVTAPYHLLVRAYQFGDLSPHVIRPEQLVVPTMTGARQVAPNEVLCEGITMGSLSVTLVEDPDHVRIGEIQPNSPEARRPSVAARNPVPLARHAITTCDLFVVTQEQQAELIEIRGRVVDRFSGRPLNGVRVELPNGDFRQTDAEGRFAFDRTYPILVLFSLVLVREGYEATRVSANTLSMPWLKAWRDSGEATFTLRPSRR